MPLNFLCISSYFKGEAFLRASKEAGNNVYLVTSRRLEHEPWPWESLDEVFYMPEDEQNQWIMGDLIKGLAYRMQSIKFHKIVALDDFDVEKAANLREHFRIPGMGETTARYFRDKLAMRIKARDSGIPVPAFTALFYDQDVRDFTASVPAPWLVKPRSAASATGIKKIQSEEELWAYLGQLGDRRHRHLLEKFAPGDVFHVDALNVEGNVAFARVSQYLDTPFDVAHGGGIFRSHTIDFGSDDDRELRRLNVEVMQAFGMKYSASHTEFIKGRDDGQYYFLETSSRVGGAHLADMVEASSGINLWAEWARIETAVANNSPYFLPEVQHHHAGIVVSLSRFKHPDAASFADPEVWWRMSKDWHIGLVLQSDDRNRILELLDQYTRRIGEELHGSLPAPDKPSN